MVKQDGLVNLEEIPVPDDYMQESVVSRAIYDTAKKRLGILSAILSDNAYITNAALRQRAIAKIAQDARVNKTDDTAKVSVEVDQDGKCILYASGRDEKGNATARQELCKADSVKAMFEIFYNNNWLDSSGNVKAVG